MTSQPIVIYGIYLDSSNLLKNCKMNMGKITDLVVDSINKVLLIVCFNNCIMVKFEENALFFTDTV